MRKYRELRKTSGHKENVNRRLEKNDVQLHEEYSIPSAFPVIKEVERDGWGTWHECGRSNKVLAEGLEGKRP
jgi:hypothetical protein